jgi:2-keto-4-pentenoate hydratase/2-oxohepta-3-ene-1,7-dioic acid hydratase in catechol pathway
MRLVSLAGENGPRVAAVAAGGYVDLNSADPEIPSSLRELLALGKAGLERARAAAGRGTLLDADSVRLLAPVPDPGKVICIGLNYADHAAESGQQPPSEPVVFNKFPTAVAAHGDPIVLPAASQQVDYEAELVVIIGCRARYVPRDRAMDCVAGFACGHDVSARDWQLGKPGGQWLMGKTFDTFAPFGPELVTPDEVGDCGNLGIRLRRNGEVMQDSNTSQLIFPVDHLISYISQVCTLEPGDVLFTGTPPGVGVARKPPVFLLPGDVVEVEIERVGLLRNPVAAA